MNNNLFQVSLLTDEEVGGEGSVEVKLPETQTEIKQPEVKSEETPKQDIFAGKTTPKIEVLSAEEAGVEVEEDEETGETIVKPVKQEKAKEEISLDYKTLAESRINSGAWEKYENWEDLKDSVEWTPELFEKLETEQFHNKVTKAVEEEKSQFGSQYKVLLEHAKNGGNVQDLLPSIQQELDVESLDENDEDSAEELVRAECQAKEWSEKRTKAYIDGLKDQGLLQETAKESKESLKKIIEIEKQTIIGEQKRIAEQNKIYWEDFNKKVRESVFKDEELSSKEQKDLEKFAFEYKHVNPETGQKFSDFNIEFENIKKDPAKYAKLIKVVKNFNEVVKKETAKKEAIKEVSFRLRGAQASLGNNKTTESPEFKKPNAQKGQFNPFGLKK